MEPAPTSLADDLRPAWHRFVDVFEPLRPDLYRYSRYLTRSPWEAEDLVQDTLARAFVTIACSFAAPVNPKAWLFRVASNLWIDRVRQAREVLGDVPDQAVEDERVDRDAAASLIGLLAPQERAAVVLKDVFAFSLIEIAESLSTTVGAVKAALHRGRGKLGDVVDAPPPASPDRSLVDAFCEAFNDRDIDRLTALLLENGSAELVGVVVEYGPEAASHPETGSLAGLLGVLSYDERGGVEPQYLEDYLPAAGRAEVRTVRGEPIIVYWYRHRGGDAVRNVARIETGPGGIRRIRHYFYVPDVIAEVCRELDLPFRINGYRYWPPNGQRQL